MNAGSLFSGIGGFDLGFERAGIFTTWQCEIDAKCRNVLRGHFPGAVQFSDIRAFVKLLKHYQKTRQYEKLAYLKTKIINGGSPCQDLSVAGLREGLDGERSGLFRDMVRICRILRPRIVVWENVPGALSSNGGKDFAKVIGYFTGIVPCPPPEGWGNAGFFKGISGLWNVAYRVLDSQNFGVPQRRRRIILVASLGDASCLEILFEPDSVCGNPAPSKKAGQGTARAFETGPGGGSCTDLAPTLDTRAKDVPIRNQLGMGIFDDLPGDDIAGTVTAKWAKGTGWPAGDECQNLIAFTGASCPSVGVGTLKSSQGRSTHSGGLPLFAFHGSQDPDVSGEVTHPLGTNQGQEACICFNIQAENSNAMNGAGPTQGVRRATPLECDRLQGFPDDWTRYGADGEEMSDSARYKMCGNAVTATVAEWLGNRTAKVLQGRRSA